MYYEMVQYRNTYRPENISFADGFNGLTQFLYEANVI